MNSRRFIIFISMLGASAAAENPRDRDLADRILRKGALAEFEAYETYPNRLDSWLARGNLTKEFAASGSPKTLLAKLAREGVSAAAAVQHETWIQRQFSHVYRDQLRISNRGRFENADALAGSIRDALGAIDLYHDSMISDRFYGEDMIWGHAEWLLFKTKPEFIAANPNSARLSGELYDTLVLELQNVRDSSGNLAKADLGRFQHNDEANLKTCIRRLEDPLGFWTKDGQDFLLAELILATRDRHHYYYGGSERPRSATLIHTREARRQSGKVMLTFSTGRREVWDSSPNCASPSVWYDAAFWIRQRGGRQLLKRYHDGEIQEFKPMGTNIRDYDQTTIVSADESGDVWIEKFDKRTGERISVLHVSAPKPEPFPNWAIGFQRLWESD
ncbi:MAG: hypothetical protein AAF585_25075 [Verrucomicrobiota bacterium]